MSYRSAAVLAVLAAGATVGALHAQSTGQVVYASPSGSDWYSGCVVKDGRSNNSLQVQCGDTVYWVTADRISTAPPAAMADPMRPGRMIAPSITPSHTPGAVSAVASGTGAGSRVPAAGAQQNGSTYRQINGGIGPGSYARSAAAPAPVKAIRIGHYPCWSGRTPAGFAMNIRSASSYDDGAGRSGSFRYDPASGKLTFTSGPYAGRASILYNDGSIGLSQTGRDNYGTQCYQG